MPRVHAVDPLNAEGRNQELFNTIDSMFGKVPNNFRTAANSPVVLKSLLEMLSNLSEVGIGTTLFNQILLQISNRNQCRYCTSLLVSTISPQAGLSAAQILDGQAGVGRDTRTQAALDFAREIIDSKGHVNEEVLKRVRDAGFNDSDIVEIIATVSLACFTNFLNNVADTELDIPQAKFVSAA